MKKLYCSDIQSPIFSLDYKYLFYFIKTKHKKGEKQILMKDKFICHLNFTACCDTTPIQLYALSPSEFERIEKVFWINKDMLGIVGVSYKDSESEDNLKEKNKRFLILNY